MSGVDFYIWALCVWREFRGEPVEAMTAGAWVMRNRLDRKTFGATMIDVVTCREQFSAMTSKGDPNLVLWPNQWTSKNDLAAWVRIQGIVGSVAGCKPEDDPTHGATHYYATSIPQPSWAYEMTVTAHIGRTVFLS